MDRHKRVSRKTFLKTALAAAGAFPLNRDRDTPSPIATTAHARHPVVLENAHWRLDLAAGEGLNVELTSASSGITLAQGPYSYSFGSPSFADIHSDHEDHPHTLSLMGQVSGFAVQHTFRISPTEPWIDEQVTIVSRSAVPVSLPYGRGGFVLPVVMHEASADGPLRDFKFVAVPFRREPGGDRKQYADYSIAQVLSECRRSELRATLPVARWGRAVVPRIFETGVIHTDYPLYASEGWVLTDGRRGFLITKYSQNGMEWALLDRVPLDNNRVGLRWGGFGIYEGDPEHGAWIDSNSSYSFGVTRVTAFEGGIREGFYAFRREMESRGHGCRKDFNPPVHWNELYDNRLWWLPDWGMEKPENRKKYYGVNDLKIEAAKARDIGCEALYLDPGWDTAFASKIWDEPRLGPLSEFTAVLRRDYGLSLSLHTPLSGWCDPSSYPRETDRMNPDGTRMDLSLCGASRQYINETRKRLDDLARGGARFFMFDGTMCNGPCWDPAHGHRVPSGRQEHVETTNELVRLVHDRYPEVLVEMHDQMLGGTHLRYVPTYFGHGAGNRERNQTEAQGFDSIWAFELMWDPMTDLVGGHSIALYYFNLAYSLPLYIHIDLRKDNAQCLMFWWNASTCRHLGVGGTNSDPAVREAQRTAMATYRKLEALFKRGTFYGIDELTHVHTALDGSAAVVNCFNLEDRPVRRSVEIDPEQVGLRRVSSYHVSGAASRATEKGYTIAVELPSYGHALVELHEAGREPA